MNVSLRGMDWKRRTLTLAAWALLALAPVALMLVLSGVLGRSAWQNVPQWTDELDYWRAVYSWLHVGAQSGYTGIGEAIAPIGPLSVHGISPLIPPRLAGVRISGFFVYTFFACLCQKDSDNFLNSVFL